jgi:hypothetical protein
MGVRVLFAPRCGGLGMRRTTAVLGIDPQTVEDVVDALAAADRRNKETERRK